MLIIQNLQSQEVSIKSFKWKKRVLLVVSDFATNEMCRTQIEELVKNKEGLKERKLLIIEVHKERYRIFDENEKWKRSNSLYDKYSNIDNNFQVVLIGLDGGVKINEFSLLKLEDLFGAIDSMPMRKSELRKNRNKG